MIRPVLLLPAVVLLTLGCAGTDAGIDQDQDQDNAPITASAANKQQYDLEHVIDGAKASDANRKAIGIVKWDVFAGRDRVRDFDGAVFYASDEKNDARYAFAINTKTGEILFAALAKDGAKIENQTPDVDTYAKLLEDVRALKTQLDSQRTSDARRGCAAGIAAAGGGLVVAAGVVAFAGVAGIASFVLLIDMELGGLAFFAAFGASSVAISAAAYKIVGAVTKPVTDIGDNCSTAFAGGK